jgi:hypothetical protein
MSPGSARAERSLLVSGERIGAIMPARIPVFVNPMKLFEWERNPVAAALPADPTVERLLQFLSTPRGTSDMASMKRRYREISRHDAQMFASIEEPAMVENLYQPLHWAKSAYVLGDVTGTVALCGMIAERAAIFLHMLQGTDEADRARFENLEQRHRIDELRPSLTPELVTAFNHLREVRRRYLHRWLADSARAAQDAATAYRFAVQIVLGIVGMAFAEGRLVLKPEVAAYLRDRGAYDEGRPQEDENLGDVL